MYIRYVFLFLLSMNVGMYASTKSSEKQLTKKEKKRQAAEKEKAVNYIKTLSEHVDAGLSYDRQTALDYVSEVIRTTRNFVNDYVHNEKDVAQDLRARSAALKELIQPFINQKTLRDKKLTDQEKNELRNGSIELLDNVLLRSGVEIPEKEAE